jgi:hypothetical protein
MSDPVQALLGGLLFLAVFVATSFLAVPLATKLIGLILKPYKAAHKEVVLIEKYLVAVIWLATIAIGLARIVAIVPVLQPFAFVFKPVVEGIEAALGIYKWLFVSLAVLLAGNRIAEARRD